MMLYGLNDRPPLGRAIALGAQHVLTMFGATVSIPLLFGPALEMSQEQIGLLISSVMLCSGIATLIQTTFGSRLPIVQGISFSFIAPFFLIVGKVMAPVEQDGLGGDGAMCMQYIAGAIIAGAVIEIVIGFSGLMGLVRRLLSPVVIGPVIMLIGLALFQHGAPKAGTDWGVSALTIVLIILFSLVLGRNVRLLRLFPILAAMVVVITLCWICSQLGIYQSGDPAYVDLEAARNSPWIRTDPSQIVFPWGLPKWHLGFFLAVLAGYLASMIESFGDYHACAHMVGAGDPTPKQISRGIGCEGIGCLLSGTFGGFSSTSYSENIGLVGLTKVGSRMVVQIGGVMLVLLGFFGKFGAMAAAIPEPVVGGLYCALFGLIAAIGVQQLAKCDLRDDRNLFIAGFSLFMGLSVPAYFAARESTTGMQPGDSLALYKPTASSMLAGLPDWVAEIAVSVGKTGMAVAAVLGLALDNLIPGSRESRGLNDPGVLVPEAGDVGAE